MLEIGIKDIIDIVIVAALLYYIYRLMKESSSANVLVGIIVFFDGSSPGVMLNPEILKKEGEYDTEEGCLSLPGVRPCRRYKTIKVEYETLKLEKRIKTYTGYTAQIIQHEIDHTNGILI